ncbi:MAG: Gfo/Idh/MocA family oxidoreductase [Gammaproteobacteria bacterium]|nr:Gfo/Idh/MocA family oxidoreductase [Gammaproteobacteria bacterium]
MSIRVAIIGAGIMGSDHARIIAEDIPGAELQVVCDTAADLATAVADKYFAKDATTDPIATISRPDVDAVLIASPDATHDSLTLAALAKSKPVLCEKPLAVDSSACLKVLEAECQLQRQLIQVGFMRRFDSGYTSMKASLLDGQLGDAVMMHNFHRNVEAPAGFTGLMAITNSAPHEFDAVRYILNSEVATIIAFEPTVNTGAMCKPVVMTLQMTTGQLATIEINNNAVYGYDVKAELVGSKGSASLATENSLRLDSALQSSTPFPADWRPRFAEAYRLQDKAWIDSINSGIPDPRSATAWDGYCASVIAEAGCRALRSGQNEKIEMMTRPELYQPVKLVA